LKVTIPLGVATGEGVGVGMGVGLGVGGGFSMTNSGDGVGRVAAMVYRGEATTAMVPAINTTIVRRSKMIVRIGGGFYLILGR
jgi:hypothetical protein